MEASKVVHFIWYLAQSHPGIHTIQIDSNGNLTVDKWGRKRNLQGHTKNWQLGAAILAFHLHASDQKFMRNDGQTANQLMKAIAVAVSKLVQWFCEHMLRSLPINTVMPEDAQAAANVSVDVICMRIQRNYLPEKRKEQKFSPRITSSTLMVITALRFFISCTGPGLDRDRSIHANLVWSVPRETGLILGGIVPKVPSGIGPIPGVLPSLFWFTCR